ncbi:MAG TPA: heavy metal translocating P-type ATPase, partial [Bacillota bacterium]|nr:heavy metal translocating P-type ATPase [Bacillota bacterium]
MTKKQIKMITRIIVSAVSCVAAFLITHFVSMAWYWRLAIFSVPYLIIGYDILIVAIRNILHGHIFDEEFLMVIATIGAFAVGEYPEAAGVMIFYQIGELFQGIAVGKSRKSIAAMMDIRPDFAVVVRDDKEETVSPDEVQVGEIIVIKPGEKIPLDGEVIDGSTSVNTAALTGESLPVDKMIGDKVV